MVRTFGSRSTNLLLVALVLAFAGWTYLVFGTSRLSRWDSDLLAAPLDPQSATAQIAAAFALLTWPGLQYAALVAIAGWAVRHRLRQLAAALVLIVGLAWGGATLLSLAFRRLRPEQALDVLTSSG
ncbi:hypothetical protein, partial [Escherichia coli]|uniref:hypothetical protein n=1 Tax=Escherichia coli TaxID=562 RepID=UPI00197AD073